MVNNISISINIEKNLYDRIEILAVDNFRTTELQINFLLNEMLKTFSEEEKQLKEELLEEATEEQARLDLVDSPALANLSDRQKYELGLGRKKSKKKK